MKDDLSNLIVPRINVNSDLSLENTIDLIKKYDFDSFILFATDEVIFKEKTRFSLERFNFIKKELQKNSRKKILFFIDAENGFGHRCGDYNEWNYMEFTQISKELYDNQISFNLAPVVDVNQFDEKILRNRCYSSNPSEVVTMASLFIDSSYLNNVIPCIKHFPGHGAAEGDTHLGIVRSDLGLDELNSIHIKPFFDLIDRVELVMLNHIHYECFDRNIVPASMSRNIINNLLINELEYKGVIISDSLQMGALTENFTQEEIIESFIKNGGDLILDPIEPKQAIEVVDKIFSQSNELVVKKIKKINNLKIKARNLLKQ
jgi:beta-N-acetylhexosaminidase